MEQFGIAVLMVDEGVAGGGVQGEVQALAIGAEGGLTPPLLEGRAGTGHYQLAAVVLAAVDGHFVDIAEQVEYQVLAVGSNVQAHPGAFADLEFGVGWLCREGGAIDVPARCVGIRSRRQGCRKQWAAAQQQEARAQFSILRGFLELHCPGEEQLRGRARAEKVIQPAKAAYLTTSAPGIEPDHHLHMENT